MAVTTGNKISFIKTPVKYDIFNYKTFSYIKDSVIFHEPTSDIFLDGKLYSAPAKNMFIIPRSSELHEPYHVIWPKADSTQRYDCMRLEEWLLDGWGGEIFTDINKNNLIE